MPATPAQTRAIHEVKSVTGADTKTATKVRINELFLTEVGFMDCTAIRGEVFKADFIG